MRMKKKNAGMSLIELVVVMFILAVLSGVTLYSIASVPRYRARECSRLIASNLREVKITTLGKAKSNGDIVWELYKKGNSYYVRYVTGANGSSPVIMGEKKVSKGTLHVYYDSVADTNEITDGMSLKLCFDRATGAIHGSDGAVITSAGDGSDWSSYGIKTDSNTPIQKIIIKGGTTLYEINLYPVTGKIED